MVYSQTPPCTDAGRIGGSGQPPERITIPHQPTYYFLARMHMRGGREASNLAPTRGSRRSGVNSIRIHLGPMPKMLRTIVGDLLDREKDLLVVGRSERG